MNLALDLIQIIFFLILIIGWIIKGLIPDTEEDGGEPPRRPQASSPDMTNLQEEIRQKIAERQKQLQRAQSQDQGGVKPSGTPQPPPRHGPAYTQPSAARRARPAISQYQEQTPKVEASSAGARRSQTKNYQQKLNEQMAQLKESQELAQRTMDDLHQKQQKQVPVMQMLPLAFSANISPQNINSSFHNLNEVRRAFIYSEIFGPPLALRKKEYFQSAIDQQS